MHLQLSTVVIWADEMPPHHLKCIGYGLCDITVSQAKCMANVVYMSDKQASTRLCYVMCCFNIGTLSNAHCHWAPWETNNYNCYAFITERYVILRKWWKEEHNVNAEFLLWVNEQPWIFPLLQRSSSIYSPPWLVLTLHWVSLLLNSNNWKAEFDVDGILK